MALPQHTTLQTSPHRRVREVFQRKGGLEQGAGAKFEGRPHSRRTAALPTRLKPQTHSYRSLPQAPLAVMPRELPLLSRRWAMTNTAELGFTTPDVTLRPSAAHTLLLQNASVYFGANRRCSSRRQGNLALRRLSSATFPSLASDVVTSWEIAPLPSQ